MQQLAHGESHLMQIDAQVQRSLILRSYVGWRTLRELRNATSSRRRAEARFRQLQNGRYWRRHSRHEGVMGANRATTSIGLEDLATRRQISRNMSRADAADQLQAAFVDAVDGDWDAATIDSATSHVSREFETLRRAVTTFVAAHKADRSPPERVLVQLKDTLALAPRARGREPEREVVRAIVLHSFLSSYFVDAWL